MRFTFLLHFFNNVKKNENMNTNEIWKDIKGYEGLYQVSSLGRVKSLTRKVKNHNDGFKVLKGRIIKNYKSKRGYYVVNLSKKSKLKNATIHRLVANSFLINKEKKPCVNHIDGNKLNNNALNLEWCTYSENNKHAYDNGLKIGYWTGKKGSKNHRSKSVICYDKKNCFVNEYCSITEASFVLGINYGGIWKSLNGYRKTCGGFIWKYKSKLIDA